MDHHHADRDIGRYSTSEAVGTYSPASSEHPEAAIELGERRVDQSDSNAALRSKIGQQSAPSHFSSDSKDAEKREPELTTNDVEYPTSARLALIMIAACLSVFCMALDNTIISTAIPKITDEFHTLSDEGWYGSAYLLCTCSFQLFFGKLYSLLSLKWVYLAAILIFEVGSAICGAAPSSTALIVGRAISGVGAAGIFSGTVLIIASTVPLKRRPAFMGGVGGMYGIASVAGPLMGGAFTDRVSWRWCFYINLPIGAATMLFIAIFYRPAARSGTQAKTQGLWAKIMLFDILGLFLFVPMIVCLLLALQWGGTTYAWSDGRVIALLVVFGLLLIAFGVDQVWKKDQATVPLRILRQRSIAAAAWFAFCAGSSFFVMLYYLPLWFQAIKGVTAVRSGIMTIPLILSLVVMSILSGIGVTRLGYYKPFLIISSILMATGAGLLSTFRTNTRSPHWIGYEVLFGLGYGCGTQHTLIAAQTVLPKADIPLGTALITFSQTLGGAVCISIAQNVFSDRLLAGLEKAVPSLDPQVVLTTGATALRGVVSPGDFPAVQAVYNTAVTNAYYVAVALASLSILGSSLIEWRSVKAKASEEKST